MWVFHHHPWLVGLLPNCWGDTWGYKFQGPLPRALLYRHHGCTESRRSWGIGSETAGACYCLTSISMGSFGNEIRFVIADSSWAFSVACHVFYIGAYVWDLFFMALAKERLQESQEVRWTTGHWEPAFRCFRVILFLPFLYIDMFMMRQCQIGWYKCYLLWWSSWLCNDQTLNWGKVWPPITLHLITCM